MSLFLRVVIKHCSTLHHRDSPLLQCWTSQSQGTVGGISEANAAMNRFFNMIMIVIDKLHVTAS